MFLFVTTDSAVITLVLVLSFVVSLVCEHKLYAQIANVVFSWKLRINWSKPVQGLYVFIYYVHTVRNQRQA
jgi:hypothetical protein